MATKKFGKQVIVTACTLAIASASGLAAAEGTTSQRTATADPQARSQVLGNEARDAAQQVTEAAKVVNQMERDAGMNELLQQARGIFIVPDYGRAAVVVGGRGGEGVMLVKRGDRWSDPAFYNIGGISAGAQAGVEAGSIALVLNNDKAVRAFMQNNNWSLNAEAGLTVVNWSGKAQESAGRGDVTVWADTEGLLAGVQLSVTDISFDADETNAFYGRKVALRDIFDGRVSAPPQVAVLKQALTAAAAPTSAGDTSAGEAAGGTESRSDTPAGRDYQDTMPNR